MDSGQMQIIKKKMNGEKKVEDDIGIEFRERKLLKVGGTNWNKDSWMLIDDAMREGEVSPGDILVLRARREKSRWGVVSSKLQPLR